MSQSFPSESDSAAAGNSDAPAADLIRSNHALRDNLRRLGEENQLLLRRCQNADEGLVDDRRRDRDAVNLMEDAVRAQHVSERTADQLHIRNLEREAAEQALLESEKQLQAATDRLRQLSLEFDERVLEQTRELQQREEHLGRLAAQIKRVERQDRQRLARLLHDHVQQMLVGAHLQLDLIAGRTEAPQPEEIDNLKSLLREAIHATRDLAVQLTPPLLHEQGLPAALEWLISRMTKDHGLRIAIDIDEDANPHAEEDRDILFQAAQEFLLNAAKYADTKDVELRLHRRADKIVLEVTDQGRGFDPPTAAKLTGSFGLLQLRQRLNSVGGTLTIISRPGHGTAAAATVPFDSEQTAPSND